MLPILKQAYGTAASWYIMDNKVGFQKNNGKHCLASYGVALLTTTPHA